MNTVVKIEIDYQMVKVIHVIDDREKINDVVNYGENVKIV